MKYTAPFALGFDQGIRHSGQKCQKYQKYLFSIYSMTFPFGKTGMELTPICVRPDHVITGANQRTLGAGNGERVGVDR